MNNGKHVFITRLHCPHTENLLLNLIYNGVLNKSDILLVLYKDSYRSAPEIMSSCTKHGLTTVLWEDIKNTEQCFLSLNSMSLQYHTAAIIKQSLDNDFVDISRVNILITDSEVERWFTLYRELGELRVNKQAVIDENVLEALNKVDNFITPYSPWGERLEEITGRRLNIVDAILPFNVIDYSTLNILENNLNLQSIKNELVYKILLFTKPSNKKAKRKIYLSIISALLSHQSLVSNKKIVLTLWLNNSLEDLTLLNSLSVIARFRKVNISFETVKPMHRTQYLLMLHEHDCLILQSRGGFSTAKYFAEKVGKVITITNTYNDLSFKRDYGLETFSSLKIKDALISAVNSVQKDESDIINYNMKKISKHHHKSSKILKEYWNNFN